MSEEHDLGTCCRCEMADGVRNIIMLPFKAPIAGHGWGNALTNLPADGAVAVVCDDCLQKYQSDETPGLVSLKFACRGYPGLEGRIPIEELTEPFGEEALVEASDRRMPIDPRRN